MTYDQLVAFTSVAAEGTFTGASNALHKSQPAVSKLIRNLEGELGVVLFDRTRYRATLTDAGRVFYERAAAVVESTHALRGFGLATRILTHDAFISLPLSASLRLVRPQQLEISCITHSMGIPTPREGVAAELVYAGAGKLDDYAGAGAAGKMALVEGRATPQHAVNATRAGALGLICISGRHAHEMCCSPVWGNPSADTVAALPRVHLLSVPKADGEALRALCQRGRVEVQFTAAVRSAWTKTPIVLADLMLWGFGGDFYQSFIGAGGPVV